MSERSGHFASGLSVLLQPEKDKTERTTSSIYTICWGYLSLISALTNALARMRGLCQIAPSWFLQFVRLHLRKMQAVRKKPFKSRLLWRKIFQIHIAFSQISDTAVHWDNFGDFRHFQLNIQPTLQNILLNQRYFSQIYRIFCVFQKLQSNFQFYPKLEEVFWSYPVPIPNLISHDCTAFLVSCFYNWADSVLIICWVSFHCDPPGSWVV